MSVRIALLAALCFLAACSSGSTPATPTTPSPPTAQNPPPAPPPAPPPVPSGPPTITVTAAGFSPKEVTIAVGSHVTFTNSNTRAHDIWGGIDHNNRDCPEIDVAGFLVPGQSRNTADFGTAATCAFHDHTNIGNPAFQGRIIIQ